MIGFLQRIATCALGKAGIVPRARSLFEPSSTGGGGQRTSEAFTSRSTSAGSAPLAVETAHRGAAGTATQRASHPPSVDPGQAYAVSSDVVHRLSSVDAPEFARGDAHVQPLDVIQPDTRRAARRALDARRVSEAQHSTGDAASPSRAALGDVVMPALAVEKPLHVPLARSAAARNPRRRVSQEAAQNAEPVHVTIGCVEVRAAFPTAPGRSAPRKAPSSLSLDDYLRNRGRS